MPPLRLLLFDKSPAERAHSRVCLEADGTAMVAAETAVAEQLVDWARGGAVDLIVCAWRTGDAAEVAELAPLFASGMPETVIAAENVALALEAFRWGAADFLVKPLSAERCRVMLKRAHERRAQRVAPKHVVRPRTAVPAVTTAAPPVQQRLLARDGAVIVPVRLAEVLWIRSERGASMLHLQGGRVVRVAESLASLELRLDATAFLRLRRDLLVSADAIREVRPGPGRKLTVVVAGASRFQITNARWREIQQHLHRGPR